MTDNIQPIAYLGGYSTDQPTIPVVRHSDYLALLQRCEKAEAERDEARQSWQEAVAMYEMEAARVDPAIRQLELAERQRDEALKALEPFATDADIYDNQDICDGEKSFNDNITVGDLRAARNVMGEPKE